MDLMNTQETADFLRVPIATLRHWIGQGTAPASCKIGRRRMFLRSDIEDFVRAKFAVTGHPAA